MTAPDNGFFDPTKKAARINTVKQVYLDLSQLIVPKSYDTLVRIEIISSYNATTLTLGTGSALNAQVQMGDNNGIFDGAVWRTINGGADPFSQYGKIFYNDPSKYM